MVKIEVRPSESEREMRDSRRIRASILETVPVKYDEQSGAITIHSDNSWTFLLSRLRAVFPMIADSVTYVESGYQAGYEGEDPSIGIGSDWNVAFLPKSDEVFEYVFIEPSNSPPSVTDPHPDSENVDIESKLPMRGVKIKKGEYIAALHRATQEYIRLAEIASEEDITGPGAVNETLEFYYNGLDEMYQYYNLYRTLVEFRFDPESDFIQDYLYTFDGGSEYIARYAIKEQILPKEIARIKRTVTDGVALDLYESLLTHKSRQIREEAARILVEQSDNRAKDGLLWTRWTDNPDVVPHAIRALVQIGGDDVREALLDLPDFSEKEAIRKAAVEGLAEFDDEEVRTTLKAIADDGDESEAIREASRDALAALDK